MTAFPLALLLIGVSVLLNGFFAGVETGFTSARRVRLIHRARRGSRLAALTTRMLRDREEIIITAVIGNNVTIVAGTSIATATFTAWLGDGGATLAAVVMTTLNILLGEILPKSIYRARPEPLLMASSPLMFALTVLLWPLKTLAVGMSRLILAAIGQSSSQRTIGLSMEQVLRVFKMSYRGRELVPEEDALVTRFVSSSRLPVHRVLTPMERVVCVRTEDRVEDAVRLVRDHGHSRLPIVSDDGTILGLILFRDLLRAATADPVRDYLRTVICIDTGMGLDEAIAVLTDAHTSLAAVVGPDGATRGIVTLEDLLEPLVGDIADEHDRAPRAA